MRQNTSREMLCPSSDGQSVSEFAFVSHMPNALEQIQMSSAKRCASRSDATYETSSQRQDQCLSIAPFNITLPILFCSVLGDDH